MDNIKPATRDQQGRFCPATTLPWDVGDYNIYAGEEFCVASCNPEPITFASTGFDTECIQNATYIAHACNAYPKLVAVLLEHIDATDHGSVSNLRASTENMRALLRELGEEV